MKCNFDCFNCEFPDCIAQDKHITKYNQHENKIDWNDPEQRRVYMRRYMREYRRQGDEYYQKNREKILKNAKERKRKKQM